MEELHCRISGMVQGVGFRYSALTRARRLGLTGWVRNLPGGDVETRAFGDAGGIQAYRSWLDGGPPSAVVRDVQVITRRQVDRSAEIPRDFIIAG